MASSLEEVEGRVEAAEGERDALKARLEQAEKDSAMAVDSSERWGLRLGFRVYGEFDSCPGCQLEREVRVRRRRLGFGI